VAIALDASLVARAFSGDADQTREIIKKAITHKGFALVDIFQPCVTFNKVNTYKWFKEHTFYLEDAHDPHDRMAAFRRAMEHEKLPLGIFYISPAKGTFEENTAVYEQDQRPLYKREVDFKKLQEIIDSKRRD